MKNVLYRDIAEMLGKKEGTIKNWKLHSPVLLDLVKLGAFCKMNDLDIHQIKKLIELKSVINEKVVEDE